MNLNELKKEARAKGTPPQRLRELLQMDPALALVIAKSKHTPPPLLEELARHRDPSVQLAVANHPNTPPATLEYLGGHGKFTVLKAVAKHPSTPLPTLERLTEHPQSTVRQALLERDPPAPVALLERMAQDPDPKIRLLLCAWQSRLPMSAQAAHLLSRDPEPRVRQALVANAMIRKGPAWKDETWARLLEDPDPQVRAHLVQRSPLLEDEATLERFVRDPDPMVRAAFGGGVRRPAFRRRPDLLEPFRNDPVPEVRLALLWCGGAGEVYTLLRDPSPVVRVGAVEHLKENQSTHDLEPLWALAHDPAPDVRLALLRVGRRYRLSPPPQVIDLLSQDPAPEVREAACGFLSLERVIQACQDPEPRVRYAALSRLYTLSSAYAQPPAHDAPILHALERMRQDPSLERFPWKGDPCTLAEIAQERLEHLRGVLEERARRAALQNPS